MTILEFIKDKLVEGNKTSIKELGVKIGRGGSTSFWRTVTSHKIHAEELKKVIEATGEPFVILYKGEKITIK